MFNQQKPTAAQQVQQVTQQLTKALIQKEEAQAQLDEANKNIVALRNVLAGVGLGQQFSAEQQAAAQPPAEAPK